MAGGEDSGEVSMLPFLSFEDEVLRPPLSCTADNASVAEVLGPIRAKIANDFGLLSNPLIAKLRKFVQLTTDDTGALERLCSRPRAYVADQQLICEGLPPQFVCIILSGWAFRYKMLRNGHRQVLGFLIPGDICDLSFTLVEDPDYCVSVLDDSRIVKLPISQLNEAIEKNPNVRRGLQLAAHSDSVVMRQWLVNIGQRSARQRLSYFLYEMTQRLRMIGEGRADGSFKFPLNQYVLADTVGTTPVHINRILQRLRREGVIALHRPYLRILDVQKLVAIADL
ncbi:MAG: Crp/Fnr family transcriptional regulator [Sphingomicrobium sp.]